MKRIGRRELRGKRLAEECAKAAICHADFQVGDTVVDTCWGLIDPMTDDAWPECRSCGAFYLNLPEAAGDFVLERMKSERLSKVEL